MALKDNRQKLIPTPANIMRAGIKYAKGEDKLALMRAAEYFDRIGLKKDCTSNAKNPFFADKSWRYSELKDHEKKEYRRLLDERWEKFGDRQAHAVYHSIYYDRYEYFDACTNMWYGFASTRCYKTIYLPDENGNIGTSRSKAVSQYIDKPRIVKSKYRRSYRYGDIVVSFSNLKKRVLTMVNQDVDLKALEVPATKLYYNYNGPTKFIDHASAVAFVDNPNEERILTVDNSKIVSWPD